MQLQMLCGVSFENPNSQMQRGFGSKGNKMR